LSVNKQKAFLKMIKYGIYCSFWEPEKPASLGLEQWPRCEDSTPDAGKLFPFSINL
jgi:hypothetical protein